MKVVLCPLTWREVSPEGNADPSFRRWEVTTHGAMKMAIDKAPSRGRKPYRLLVWDGNPVFGSETYYTTLKNAQAAANVQHMKMLVNVGLIELV